MAPHPTRNCLFRALSDQLYGSSDSHPELRAETAAYIRLNRMDFEPFLVSEQQPFDRHLELLERDGTFGGNDSIVAFSRMRKVTVVIHQLNEKLWQVRSKNSMLKFNFFFLMRVLPDFPQLYPHSFFLLRPSAISHNF